MSLTITPNCINMITKSAQNAKLKYFYHLEKCKLVVLIYKKYLSSPVAIARQSPVSLDFVDVIKSI